MAFPLHASEISDKYETGREKNILKMLQSQPNRHISSRSNFFCTGGAKMWRFLGRMWQKMSPVKKHIFVCESVTFFPEMWQMWRVTFFVTEKRDKCDVTHLSGWVTGEWRHICHFFGWGTGFFSEKKVTSEKIWVTSFTQIWDEKLGRNSAKTDPKTKRKGVKENCGIL